MRRRLLPSATRGAAVAAALAAALTASARAQDPPSWRDAEIAAMAQWHDAEVERRTGLPYAVWAERYNLECVRRSLRERGPGPDRCPTRPLYTLPGRWDWLIIWPLAALHYLDALIAAQPREAAPR